MPCHLPDEAEIPIAWYGTSHIGMLKHVYRRGLALRYGKTMQCIAGVHYNFSLAEALWQVLQANEETPGSAMDFQSDSYIALIRNFKRYSWLLMILFGASPALSSEFLRGREHSLETLSDDTLYLPYATSLRMSDLGYQNNAQAGLMPAYNTLQSYMTSLARALQIPYPAYEKLGLRRDGEWWQINSNLLQIENEYYATIRPKRVIHSGERPLEALCARGVQYVEVRCMDVDPFSPAGITLETSRFLDAFLLFCALDESPKTSETERRETTGNFARTVKEGRRPGLSLQRGGKSIELVRWGQELIARIRPVAAMLDAQRGEQVHAATLAVQLAKLQALETTPSAKVLAAIRDNGGSFNKFGLAQSLVHAAEFRSRPLPAAALEEFKSLAQASLSEQEKMEKSQSGNFDEFIADYRQRTPAQLCA